MLSSLVWKVAEGSGQPWLPPSGPVHGALSFQALRAPCQLEHDQSSWLGPFLFLPIEKQGNSFPIKQFYLFIYFFPGVEGK